MPIKRKRKIKRPRRIKDIIPGYIYAIIDLREAGLYKLGRTTDIEERLKHLQTGNPWKLALKYTLTVADTVKAETALHTLFAADRIVYKKSGYAVRVGKKSEWFLIRDEALLLKIFKQIPTTDIEEKQLTILGLR